MYQSKHFTLEKIKEGIYAAIVTEYGGGIGNAGIIDLGDQTVIFDTFNTPQAARDLRKAAEVLIGNPVSYVVNSHWHGDHIRGNQSFEDCKIISTVHTRELMEEIHPPRIKQQQQTIDQLIEYIQTLEQEPSPQKDVISQLKEIKETLPQLKLVLPDIVFDKQYSIKGSKREVQLITYGGGHTKSDAFLYVPTEQVIFMGDLLVIQNHPMIGDGSPTEWIEILEKISKLSFHIAVPGHGPIGVKDDLNKLKQYLVDLFDLPSEIPNKYSLWNHSEHFSSNIEFLKTYRSSLL